MLWLILTLVGIVSLGVWIGLAYGTWAGPLLAPVFLVTLAVLSCLVAKILLPATHSRKQN